MPSLYFKMLQESEPACKEAIDTLDSLMVAYHCEFKCNIHEQTSWKQQEETSHANNGRLDDMKSIMQHDSNVLIRQFFTDIVALFTMSPH